MHTRLVGDGRLAVLATCVVVSFSFGGWTSAESVHEPAGVVPVHPGCGDVFNIVEGAQRPCRNGESSRMHSVLYRPMVVSASALS
jgi:hypothetical protein